MKGLIPAARAALMSGSSSITRIIVVAIVLLLTAAGCASVATAAGSCTYSSVTLGSNNIDSVRYYRYVCTAAADNSLSATMDVSPMQGRTCTKFVTTPLVAPTDASDLSLVANGITYIAAAGKGANAIDSTTVVWDYFEGNLVADGTLDGYWEPVDGKDATVTMTNNSVTLASFYLDFICY